MKVLLIEDDQSIAKVVGMGLARERIDVNWAENGNSGLRMAASNGYDAIILDLMLPDKGGEEICRQLRGANFDTPIIVLTALSDLNSKIRLFETGADDYLTKPFEFQELFARIKSALRKHKVETGDVLIFGDLQLDMKRHTVMRRGRRIDLRDKEIKILEYLMRHAEQVLSREMILDYAWGPATERYTNVVDVHIHNLREKIDKPYATRQIRTVSNVGYKLTR